MVALVFCDIVPREMANYRAFDIWASEKWGRFLSFAPDFLLPPFRRCLQALCWPDGILRPWLLT